jgi:para-aminobenzoate N-oxygenase AurF
MPPRTIASPLSTTFELDYAIAEPDIRRLYENAKRDQWNASVDIPWSTPEPDDGRVLADELVDIFGSPMWDKLGEKDRVTLNRRIAAWRLGVLMYGEQGALLTCSQLVDLVRGTDYKFFQATQVMDEARHNEVLDRYIRERLGDVRYEMPANERDLFDAILSESRWHLKTIALQLVAETFAVSLFRMMAESARDPVLGEVCRRILGDESRHMGFGMLSLPDVVREASAQERREMEDYTVWALEKTLTGFFPLEAYADLGLSAAEIDEVKRYRRETAAKNDYAPFRKYFKRDMHGSMVQNLARIGLLTERVRPRLEALGVTLPPIESLGSAANGDPAVSPQAAKA